MRQFSEVLEVSEFKKYIKAWLSERRRITRQFSEISEVGKFKKHLKTWLSG